MEAQIYRECLRYYPFVLGAQPVRPVDLAAFYAAIANEGLRPSPHVIDSIERNGLVVHRHDPKASVMIGSVDRAAFYQLKTLMQGVLSRGTARAIAGFAPSVAGKTGTSDEENDAWFVGFTNEVTVAVFRVDAKGKIINTQNALMARGKDQDDEERPRRRARSQDDDERPRKRAASREYWQDSSQWGWRYDSGGQWQGGWRYDAGRQWEGGRDFGWGRRW